MPSIAGAVVPPRDIFRINDINLTIPPSQISVRKEDLTWSWKTLRTKASTKIASGHGMVQASLNIIFTPDLILDMHRLIVQFRHSPFCWIENDYLRQTIVPHWPLWQAMAFTMSSISVVPMSGHPGTFVCELDLRWLNYFPYGFNYLFKREWLTQPHHTGDGRTVRVSIPVYGPAEGNELSVVDTEFYTDGELAGAVEKFDIIAGRERKDILAGATVHDLEAQHLGRVFDNLPLPNRMERAEAVDDPAKSNIYVRYINSLQQKALWDNFGIDCAADIIAFDKKLWESFTVGEEQESGSRWIVRRLNDSQFVPGYILDSWLSKILATTKSTTFTWHQYLTIQLAPKLQMAMAALHKEVIRGEVERLEATALLVNRRRERWAKRKYEYAYDAGAEVPGAPGAEDPRLMYLRWYPPAQSTGALHVGSPFTNSPPYRSIRGGPPKPHLGIDIGIPVGTPIFATQAGRVTRASDKGDPGGNTISISHGPSLPYTTSYCHLSGFEVKKDDVVVKGQLIGYSGGEPGAPGAGNTTGPHLHYAIYSTAEHKFLDPYPHMVDGSQYDPFPEVDPTETVPEEIDESVGEPIPTDQSTGESAYPGYEPSIFNVNPSLLLGSEEGSALGLSTEEVDKVVSVYSDLSNDGWSYYEEDQTVKNVWYRPMSITVQSSNQDIYTDYLDETPEGASGELLYKEGAIITSAMGGLQHVIASIPIIGHEFPTHQHLGSVEPSYMIELAVLDDSGKSTGISTIAQMLETMRASLQEYSRSFRIVPDSWTLCVDHFTTRLFGTYSENDILHDVENQTSEIKKRASISAVQTETREGNPGLSSMMFEIAETNPYVQEFITADRSKQEDIETRREKVLKKLFDIKFSDKIQAALIFSLGESLTYDEREALSTSEEWKKINEGITGPNPKLIKFTEGATNLGGSITDALSDTDNHNYDYLLQAAGIVRTNRTGYDIEKVEEQLRGTIQYDPLYGEGTVVGASPSSGSTGATSANPRSNLGRTHKLKVYDATEFYRRYPELEDLDVAEVAALYELLTETLQLSRRLMIEEKVNGALGKKYVGQQLYNFGELDEGIWVEPLFYTQFSYFIAYILQNPNVRYGYEGDGHVIRWENILAEDAGEVKARAGLHDFMTTGLRVFWSSTGDLMLQQLATMADGALLLFAFIDSLFGKDEVHWAPFQKALENSTRKERLQDAVDGYLNLIPISVEGVEQVLGSFPLLADFTRGSGDGGSQIFSLHDSLDRYLTSCWFAAGRFERHLPTILQSRGINQSDVEAFARRIKEAHSEDKQIVALANRAIGSGGVDQLQALVEALPNSPARFPCSTQIEEKKVQWLRSLLAKIADRILGDPTMLTALDLADLISFDIAGNYQGSTCYPDLDLPAHPYYPERLNATTPDFYMWNMYEDGPGALSQEMLNIVEETVGTAVQGPYEHLKSMMGEGIKPFTERDDFLTVVGDGADLTPKLSSLQASWEGSDGNLVKMGKEYLSVGEFQAAFPDKDQLETWRAKGEDGLREIEQRLDVLDPIIAQANASTAPILTGGAVGLPMQLSGTPEETEASELRTLYNALKSLQGEIRPLMPLLSAFDGNPQYSQIPRADVEDYKRLVEEIAKGEVFFGSRAGYLGTHLTKESAKLIVDSTTDTRVAAMDVYTHAFDPASLSRLTTASSSDILSEKLTMRRAYPTFKLMFVEEDEFESRWLNFDDFHSYNAVKEFTYVESRDMAASTAFITLQNVSGTLDGTKRGVITDLDYFTEAGLEQVEADLNPYPLMDSRRDSAPVMDSSLDQPFGAVVLRPGLNVQLRVGYSNDPNQLEVLLSGRVTDVTWSSNGDMAEIVVQSFGTELVQSIKGTDDLHDANRNPIGAEEIYKTTHQLLGSMMLSPELKHFGRWEFGQLYQYGEAQDSRLDFMDYARDSYLHKFKTLNGISAWIAKHPVLTAVGAVSLAALAAVLPIGRAGKLVGLGRFGRWIGIGGKNLNSGVGLANATTRRLLRAGKIPLTPVPSGVPAIYVGKAAGVLGRAPIRQAHQVMAGRAAAALGRQIGSGNYSRAAPKLLRRAAQGYSARIVVPPSAGQVAAAERIAYLQHLAGVPNGLAPIKAAVMAGGARAVLGTTKEVLRVPWNVLWGSTRSGLRVGAVALTAALAVDLSRYVFFTPLYQKTIGNLKKFYARTRVSLMLSPQDDNLYPPSPKDYMRLNPPGFKEGVGRVGISFGSSLWAVLAGGAVDTNKVQAWWNSWVKPDWILDKRVEPQQCYYRASGSTVWEIFHEMSLRHPGWVYAPRPYGADFRYTMFFGVPGQRYWAKPASNQFIFRMNMLRDMLEAGEINWHQFTRLYGEKEYERLVAKTQSDAIQEYVRTVEREGGSPLSVDQVINTAEDGPVMTMRMTNRAMDEYLQGLEARFIPFRRYHMLTSEQDIVSNNIMSSEHNVANAVAATYVKTEDPDIPVGSVTIRANSMIPEHNIRTLAIQYPNCRGYTMGLRYAMGQLMYEMRQMYRGELLILGNPRIRPWDICILLDKYTDMAGPIEVEQVVHTFSHETGFLTEIKPNALVFANEISTWPIIEGLKLFAMAVKDNESIRTPGDTSSIIEEAWGDRVSDEFKEHMATRYGELFTEGFDLTHALPAPSDELGLRNTFVLDDIEAGYNKVGPVAMVGFTYAAMALAAGAGFVGGAVIGGPIGGMIGGAGVGALMGTAFAGVGSIAGAAFVASRASAPPSFAWLLAGPVLFNKCLQEDVIAIVPLLKNGQPIVSGLTYRDPMAFWSSVRGKVSNIVDDTYEGTRDTILDWQMFGFEWWRRFNDPNIDKLLG
jgi:murein DD-endopeptidase MepM/ murein hydrolase activator NlpD